MKEKNQKSKKYFDFLNYSYQDYIDDFFDDYCLNENISRLPGYTDYFNYQFIRPTKILDEYTYVNYQLSLYESLKTHSLIAFENKLYDYCVTAGFISVDNDSLNVLTENEDDFDLIKQLCTLYGYYVVMETRLENGNWSLIIEPTFGYTEKTDFIYNSCKGVLYHVTARNKVNKILKYGLAPKHLDKKVTHPGRVYLMTTDDPEEWDNLGRQLYAPRQRFAVLKVDLSKMPYQAKLKFWQDPVYVSYGMFTCENISPNCISVVQTN